jgi:hypothetical protein
VVKAVPEAAPARERGSGIAVRDHVRSVAARVDAAAFALAAYLAAALFVTWPWVTDPTGTLYGVIGGDLISSVSGFEQLVEEHQIPFLPGEITQLNAPEGLATPWALHLAAFGSSMTLWLLTLAFGSVAAHGIVAVLGYSVSAFAMFLLVRFITGHAGAAFVVGLAFGYWPYMYGTGFTWPHYIHLWVLVLLVWRMVVLADKPTRRNGLLAGAAALFAMTWIAYNLLIAGVVYATLAVLAVVRSAFVGNLRPQLIAQSVAGGMVGLVLLGLLVAGRITDWEGVPTRTTADLVANSARPAMYVVPGPEHPLLGDRTGPWLFERFSPTVPNPPPDKAIYADIYLGAPLVLLAFVGAVWTLVMVRRQPRLASTRGAVGSGLMAMILGAVAFAFSAPPKVSVLGVLIPMPYSVIEHVTTVFRVPHRFATVLMLAVCLLAGLALAAFLRRRPVAFQAIVLIGLAAIFAVDLRAMPSPSTTMIDKREVYQLLERQPPGIVAEYPLSRAFTVETVESLYQDQHDKPLFAGAPVGSDIESRKFELQYLPAERTIPDLAAYGVDYVLVHHKSLPPSGAVPGLRVIGGDASATLYRVVAHPSAFTSYGLRGFHLTEGASPGMRWTGENGAELELRGRCRPCVGTVSFSAASFAEPRVLTVSDERGRTLSTTRVETTGSVVRFPARFSSRTVVRLSTDPPPQRIDSVIPGPDTRAVSITVVQPVRFRPDPSRGHRPGP